MLGERRRDHTATVVLQTLPSVEAMTEILAATSREIGDRGTTDHRIVATMRARLRFISLASRHPVAILDGEAAARLWYRQIVETEGLEGGRAAISATMDQMIVTGIAEAVTAGADGPSRRGSPQRQA